MSLSAEQTVLHVTNRWEMGGTARYIHDLCTGMRSRGMRADIAAWNQTRRPSYADETFHALPLYLRGGERKSLTGFLRSMSILRRYLREQAVTIVHTHNRYVMFLFRLAARNLPVAHVHTLHNPFTDKVRFIRYPRNVICPTACVRDTFLSLFPGADRSAVQVIYHGIDHDGIRDIRSVHPPRDGNVQPSVIFLGRHTADKGGQVLVEALRLLDDRGRMSFKIHFVGDGLQKGVWMQRAREAGLIPRIEFHQSTSYPLCELALANVAVFPSNGLESFGYSFVEAAALGLRVIASDIPAFRELRDRGVPCTLVPEGDARTLADALDTTISDFTRSGHIPPPQLPLGMFTFREMMEKTLEVYSRAVEESRPG